MPLLSTPIRFGLFAAISGLALANILSQTMSRPQGPGPSLPGPSSRAVQAAVPVPAGTSSRIELYRSDNGHYQTDVEIGGRRIKALVDTGATVVALTYEDASAAGIHPMPSDFTVRVSTANGMTTAAPVRLSEVRLGGMVVRDVQAVIHQRGALTVTLLGMSFLNKLSWSSDNGRLVLRQ